MIVTLMIRRAAATGALSTAKRLPPTISVSPQCNAPRKTLLGEGLRSRELSLKETMHNVAKSKVAKIPSPTLTSCATQDELCNPALASFCSSVSATNDLL